VGVKGSIYEFNGCFDWCNRVYSEPNCDGAFDAHPLELLITC